jgi:hypothetical protein
MLLFFATAAKLIAAAKRTSSGNSMSLPSVGPDRAGHRVVIRAATLRAERESIVLRSVKRG